MLRTALVISLLLAGVAHAETKRRPYDAAGHPQGRIESQGNTTRYYDKDGHPRGHAEDQGSTTRYFDRDGHPAGRDEAGPGVGSCGASTRMDASKDGPRPRATSHVSLTGTDISLAAP